jgi:hypothetical protein
MRTPTNPNPLPKTKPQENLTHPKMITHLTLYRTKPLKPVTSQWRNPNYKISVPPQTHQNPLALPPDPVVVNHKNFPLKFQLQNNPSPTSQKIMAKAIGYQM